MTINRTRNIHLEDDEVIGLKTAKGHSFTISLRENQVYIDRLYGGVFYITNITVIPSEQSTRSVIGILLD